MLIIHDYTLQLSWMDKTHSGNRDWASSSVNIQSTPISPKKSSWSSTVMRWSQVAFNIKSDTTSTGSKLLQVTWQTLAICIWQAIQACLMQNCWALGCIGAVIHQCYFWDLVLLDSYLWVILELIAMVLTTVANLGAFGPTVSILICKCK